MPRARPTLSYWLTAIFLGIWGLAYGFLVLNVFLLSTPEDLDALVSKGDIRQGYRDYIDHIPCGLSPCPVWSPQPAWVARWGCYSGSDGRSQPTPFPSPA